jgi:hypothetical protein
VANPAAVEYEAAVAKVYDGPAGSLNPSLSREQVDNIMNKHIFLWKSSSDDPVDSYLLHEPSMEERCVLIAKAFKYVPKLLEFCWMSKPEYLQYSEVSAILKNRSMTAVVKPDMVEDEDEDYSNDAVVAAAPKSTAKPASKPQPAVKSNPAKVAKSALEIVDEFEDEIDEDKLEDEDGGEEEEIGNKGKPADKQSGKPKVSKDKFEDDADEEDDFDDAADEEDDFDNEADNKSSKGSKVSKGNKEDEDSEESDDFDDEAENSGLEADLEEQLNQSVSRANAIARSRNRTSPEPEAPKKPRRSK